MPPKKYTPPADLTSKYDATPDTLEKSIDNILLSEDDFTKIERTPSGSILTTRKSATPEELSEAKRIKIERRRAANLAAGSADVAGEYEPGLELVSEPAHTFSKPADPDTTRIDHK